jgi:hypothetical protein
MCAREGSAASRRCAAACASAADTLDENLGLVIEVKASVLLENETDVREDLERNRELGLDVTVFCVCYCAGILVVLGEGAKYDVC